MQFRTGEPLALAALATGLEVVVIGCLWFVQCLFAGRESFWRLTISEQVNSSASKPAVNADGSLKRKPITAVAVPHNHFRISKNPVPAV